jgi:hypothetical protein
MTLMTFGEILKHFKEVEAPENIVPLVEGEELRNGVVAWKSVVVSYSDNEPCEVEDEAAQWEWLWSKVKFDLRSFAVVAGVPPQNGGNLYQRLKGLRLIYPDGTIHNFAAKYLQAIIMAKLPKPKPQKNTKN